VRKEKFVENKGCYINALPAAGELTFLAVLTEKELRPKRNGGVYLHLRLADRTGELDAKVWDRPEETAQSVDRDEVVKVRGTVEQYNERPQLIVSKIRQCAPEEYRADDFCPTSEQDPEAMYGHLLSYVETIQRPALRELLRTIVEDPGIREKLTVTPAALKIHHAFRSGLLEHIVSMCELSVLVVSKYPRLELDWLLAGAVLHDLGKTETLEIKGLRFKYTELGQLLEHIALGLEILDRFAASQPAFPRDLKMVLQHLIVSHHGDLDKGALRLPMMPEAIALNLIDLLDARMDQVFRCVDQAQELDAFTAYVPSLARQLFRKSGIGREESVEAATRAGAGGKST
jgi:3'-5' exoribonuclease